MPSETKRLRLHLLTSIIHLLGTVPTHRQLQGLLHRLGHRVDRTTITKDLLSLGVQSAMLRSLNAAAERLGGVVAVKDE